MDELAEVMEQTLDPVIQRLVHEDITSGDGTRQQKAAEVIGSLGEPCVPLLVEIIKQERDYRLRQMAATMLARMGPDAESALKREMILEITVIQRSHILEVIDTVTHDLLVELGHCIDDENPKIRRAAFRLADRLKDPRLAPVLIPHARSEDLASARGAIRSLAILATPQCVQALIAVLDETKHPEVAIACAQALGQIGDEACLQALSRLLAPTKSIFARKMSERVRATAALALSQNPDPAAASALARFRDDPDPRIRQLAEAAVARASAAAQRAARFAR